jgi:FtsH-binding integral membrane protein
MPTSLPPSASNPQDPASRLTRFGAAVGLATLCALACSFPAMMRIASAVEDGRRGQLWLALAAATLGPMVVSVAVLRGAREGLRTLGGPDVAVVAFGTVLWLATLLVGLSLFGTVLRATTHHHALAGVTFGFGAIVLAIVSGLVCARIVAILKASSPRARRILAIALGAVACSGIAWVLVGFLRAVSSDGASSAAPGTVIDVLAFVLAALFGARRSPLVGRPMALLGPPLAAVVLAIGVSALRDPSVLDAIGERAPAFAPGASLAVFR